MYECSLILSESTKMLVSSLPSATPQFGKKNIARYICRRVMYVRKGGKVKVIKINNILVYYWGILQIYSEDRLVYNIHSAMYKRYNEISEVILRLKKNLNKFTARTILG